MQIHMFMNIIKKKKRNVNNGELYFSFMPFYVLREFYSLSNVP